MIPIIAKKVFRVMWMTTKVVSIAWFVACMAFILWLTISPVYKKWHYQYEDLGEGYNFCIDKRSIHKGKVDDTTILESANKLNYDDRFIIAKEYLGRYKRLPDFYMIVDKKADKVYEPLSPERFAELCDSLGVTVSLSDDIIHSLKRQ